MLPCWPLVLQAPIYRRGEPDRKLLARWQGGCRHLGKKQLWIYVDVQAATERPSPASLAATPASPATASSCPGPVVQPRGHPAAAFPERPAPGVHELL